MNGFVRFLGGLCVFVSVVVLCLFVTLAYNTYQSQIKQVSHQESYYDAPGGFSVIARAENKTDALLISMLVLSVGIILSLILIALGEGLILVAQVREEHSRTLRLVNRMALLLADKSLTE